MVVSTPNINDTSQTIISEEVFLRIKADNELRLFAKWLRTALVIQLLCMELRVVWFSEEHLC